MERKRYDLILGSLVRDNYPSNSESCDRCICIEHDQKRGLQRWNFPFQSLELAKLYLRSADYTMKKACGIYEIKNDNGRICYKIFVDQKDLEIYLNKNKNMFCEIMELVFQVGSYREYSYTQVRKLTPDEIKKYMRGRNG